MSIANSNIFDLINNRRSIRSFTDQEISDEILQTILAAGLRAPFAAQLYSIIYTKKPDIIKKVRKLGIYKSTKALMIFLLDVRKLEKLMTAKGHQYNYDDLLTSFFAIQDATLAAENIILAAEAYGLGSVLLGVAPLEADLLAEVFNIPKRVFPLVGLCMGYPDESVETDIRPRYPVENVVFKDSYKDLTDADVNANMKAMDEGYLTQGYYIKAKAKIPLKAGNDTIDYDKYSWSEHISRKFCQGKWSEDTLLQKMKKHGFNID